MATMYSPYFRIELRNAPFVDAENVRAPAVGSADLKSCVGAELDQVVAILLHDFTDCVLDLAHAHSRVKEGLFELDRAVPELRVVAFEDVLHARAVELEH